MLSGASRAVARAATRGPSRVDVPVWARSSPFPSRSPLSPLRPEHRPILLDCSKRNPSCSISALFSTSLVGRNQDSAEGISRGGGRKHSHHPTDTGTNLKSTLPSSAEPIRLDHAFDKLEKEQKESIEDGDSGYLAFTKASLFKLTLPLFPPDKKSDPTSSTSKASSPLSKSLMAKAVKESDREGEHNAESENDSGPMSAEPWEHRVDRGEQISQVMSPDSSSDVKRKGKSGHPVATKKGDLHGPENGEPSDDQSLEFDSRAPAKSVVFLLHSGQPLSYIASLIRAEEPSYQSVSSREKGASKDETIAKHDFEPTITFHTRQGESKRWSPATGIGDFLRDAARIGSFVVKVGDRNIDVSVPSFEDRTRFLRSSLNNKTARIQKMAQLKAECDRLAHTGTRKFAFAGAGILVAWWCAVSYLTFFTSLGWDVMEPVTYLMGLASLMAGYSFFLFSRKDVSARVVLKETTSQAQTRLYTAKNFDPERYVELIEEAKELRRAIKRVAEDYDLEWDQGETMAGKKHKKALEVVRKSEERENSGSSKKRKDDEDDEAEDEDEDDEDVDEDADGTPDKKQRSKKRPKEKVRT